MKETGTVIQGGVFFCRVSASEGKLTFTLPHRSKQTHRLQFQSHLSTLCLLVFPLLLLKSPQPEGMVAIEAMRQTCADAKRITGCCSEERWPLYASLTGSELTLGRVYFYNHCGFSAMGGHHRHVEVHTYTHAVLHAGTYSHSQLSNSTNGNI